jgi:hypothetical protein
VDVSQAAAGAAEANFLSAANVIRAKHLLGERAEELSIIAMHSSVYAYLQAIGALTFSTSALSTGGAITWGGGGVGLTSDSVANFMGLRVVVDDLIAPTVNAGGADQFPVYLMTQGAVAEGVQQEMRIEADRNILSLQDVLQLTITMACISWAQRITEQTIQTTQHFQLLAPGVLRTPSARCVTWSRSLSTALTLSTADLVFGQIPSCPFGAFFYGA